MTWLIGFFESKTLYQHPLRGDLTAEGEKREESERARHTTKAEREREARLSILGCFG